MKRLTGFVVAALIAFAPAAAMAQQKGAAPKRSDDCAEQRKHNQKGECTLIIDGSEIGGEKILPDGDKLLGRHDIGFGSLIRVRANYVDKILKDAANL
jgi:hypothetical protein